MYKHLFSFLVLLTAISTQAQQYKIDTLQFHKSDHELINLVILADGYTKDEMNYFKEDANRFTDYFFQTEPFTFYRNYFNVFTIESISKESGAVHRNDATDCPTEHS